MSTPFTINRRGLLKAAGTLALTAAVLSPFAFGQEAVLPAAKVPRQPTSKPNIVFILADDIGYGDFSCYGARLVNTPNLDRMAMEGVRFTDAHSPSAMCSPTRYALLAGEYAWRCGVWGIYKGVMGPESPLSIKPGRETLPAVLASAGYTTGCVGKWHLGFGIDKPDYNGELKPGPLEVGFD